MTSRVDDPHADVPDIPLGYGGGFLNLIPRR